MIIIVETVVKFFLLVKLIINTTNYQRKELSNLKSLTKLKSL